jgi:hypothetical protein
LIGEEGWNQEEASSTTLQILVEAGSRSLRNSTFSAWARL